MIVPHILMYSIEILGWSWIPIDPCKSTLRRGINDSIKVKQYHTRQCTVVQCHRISSPFSLCLIYVPATRPYKAFQWDAVLAITGKFSNHVIKRKGSRMAKSQQTGESNPAASNCKLILMLSYVFFSVPSLSNAFWCKGCLSNYRHILVNLCFKLY